MFSFKRSCAALALLLCAAGAQAAEAQCRYSQLMELPVNLGRGMHLLVDGKINEQPVTMMLDTGAWSTAVTRPMAEKLGLWLEPKSGYSYGVGGAARNYVTKVKQISLKELEARNAPMNVIDGDKLTGFDVILGVDFLLQADLEVSLADKKLRFFRSQGCEQKGLGYWSADVMDVPLIDDRSDRRPLIEVELNGKKVIALIDTGAPGSTVDADLAQELGVSPIPGRVYKAQGIGNEVVEQRPADFATLKIGDELIKTPRLAILQRAQSGYRLPRMILGADYLKAHRILIARSQNRLYYSYSGGAIFDRFQ
ncbi:aspartyl protease family protein [Oxalobacteraceae bacterium A2-2]